ncbi:MAG: O-antigen ligase family protein, partial [Angustibacter sp.]
MPAWPFAALFIGFPICWLLGLRDVVWSLAAIPMLLYMLRRGHNRAPLGFGVWVAFLVWMLASSVMLDTSGRVVGFAFRATLYLSATIVFLYVYNASETRLPTSRVSGVLTAFWAFIVAGGFLGLLLPNFVISTPVAKALPSSLLSNDVIASMVFPRFTQYNPD